jgi:transposase
MKKFIIGVDVSKLKLDVHCYGQQQSFVFTNDVKGYRQFLKWVKKQVSKKTEELMVVMEYTGIYTYNFENYLFANQVSYVKRPALDIKNSVGMKRGKTDRADAIMISEYGWYRKEELKPMKPVSDEQRQLQQLMAYRDKLVADKASYESRLKELKIQMANKLSRHIVNSSEAVMELLIAEIKGTEIAIETMINKDEELKTNYELVKSICGIGFVTAVHLLVATENFTRFDDPRKFACYSGVAPFEYSSGKSIRGKTRTSHLANKKIKSLLTMAAISAIQHDMELKAKYKQKIAEGKPKMSALNIIRFKLIERIFAVIKRQSVYVLRKAA